MLSPQTIAIVTLILFSSSLVRSSLGFGDALVAMPFLTMLFDSYTAAAFFSMATLSVAIYILWHNWRDVNLGDGWRLIVGGFIGIPLGLTILHNLPESTILMALGIILIGYGLYNLLTPLMPQLKTETYSFVFGFFAGLLGGAYNVHGPPLVVYGSLRRWSPEQFRVTLQSYFLPAGLFVLFGHIRAGSLTIDSLKLCIIVQPAVIGATILGGYLNHRIPHTEFKRIIYVFLVIIGVYMIVP